MVLGPELVPVVTDGEPPVELVVLSAVAHGGDPERRGILAVLLRSLSSVEKQDGSDILNWSTRRCRR